MSERRDITSLADLQLSPAVHERVLTFLREFVAAEAAREVRRLTDGQLPPNGALTYASNPPAPAPRGSPAQRRAR